MPPSTLLVAFALLSTCSSLVPSKYLPVGSSRRAFLSTPLLIPLLPQSASAFGSNAKTVNSKLKAYGLPPLVSVPDGFSPLLELYGNAANRKPLLVQFCYPSTWVVIVPNQDKNGEEGTIQAGNYGPGDTATLYVDPGAMEIASQPASFFREAVIKSISQKGGGSMYQEFKVTKLTPQKGEYKDQDYMIVDFKYELLTGAGFSVERKGVASVTSTGDSVQVLWAASTAAR